MKTELVDVASFMLDLKCRNSGESILIGEVVKIHNWGIRSSDEVIGYGHFDWDKSERKFEFVPNETLNIIYGISPNSTVDDSYDLFRTTPAKLSKAEFDALGADSISQIYEEAKRRFSTTLEKLG